MCGRYTLATFNEQLAEEFDLIVGDPLTQRFNIAPTQLVPVIRLHVMNSNLERRLDQLRWGLIPHWAKDKTIGSRMINARSEEAAGKPAFCAPLRRQRCLVPATGFFEWRTLDETKGARPRKQPYYIRRRDERPFAFAGLWDRWEEEDGVIESFTILTTASNQLIRPLHERMPVILRRSDYELWLDPQMQDTQRLAPLFTSFPDDELAIYPVDSRVNNVKFDDAACIQAAG